MATVDTLLVKIEADMSDLRKQLNKSTQAVNKSVKTQQGAFSKLARTLKTVGVIAAGALAVRFGASMVKMASSVEEMQSKSGVVFGRFVSGVREELSAFGDEVGRSSFQLEGMASTVQDTFVPMGFARGEAAKLSVELTKLAVDVASFNNASDEDTMRAFQSAIVGNHETVRRFGIVITEATLQQELYRMGINKTSKNASNAEKVQARLNLITAGTTDAQGDASFTASSFANSSKALSASLEELVVNVMTPLLPKLASMVQGFNDSVKAIDEFFDSVQKGDKIDNVAVATKKLADVNDELTISTQRLKKAQDSVGTFDLSFLDALKVGGSSDSFLGVEALKAKVDALAMEASKLQGTQQALLMDTDARKLNTLAQKEQAVLDEKKEKTVVVSQKIAKATTALANANILLKMAMNGRTEEEIALAKVRLSNGDATDKELQGLLNVTSANVGLKDTIERRNAEEQKTLSINDSVLKQLESISDANEILQMKINGSTDAEIKKHEAMMANIGASPEYLAVLNEQIELEAQLNKELNQKSQLENMEKIRAEELLSLRESLLTPSQELALLQNDLNNAYLAGNIAQEQYAEGTENIKLKMLEATDAGRTALEAINKVADGFANEFANALMTGELSLKSLGNVVKDVMAGLIRDFIKAQIRAMILKMILASMGMGSTAPVSGPTTISPSGFAGGGKVQAKTPVMVGERGAEMFIPNSGGSIKNAADTRSSNSGKPVVINQSINVSTGVAQTVRAEVMNLMPQISQSTISAILDAKQRGGSFATIMS